MPPLTLYFLQASRAIRTAWLLEELGLDYESVFFPRINNRAPADFKERSGYELGKSPVLKDDDLMLTESGSICEYLCETYDGSGRLLPTDTRRRNAVRQWIHAAEAVFMIHALAILYLKWFSPESAKEAGTVQATEEGMSVNVVKDFDWLESELEKGGSRFLRGDEVTAADTMMHFTVQFILVKAQIAKGRRWPGIEKWMSVCEETESLKRAVKKTGYQI